MNMVTRCLFLALALLVNSVRTQPIAINAGRLIDVEKGDVLLDQIIVVTAGKITAVGPDVRIPGDAEEIDLSGAVVLPGLMDAHTHVAMTTIAKRDFGRYFFTTIMEPTAYRAVQGVTNLRSMLEAGFTTIRDIGNNGNYGDTALRRAVQEGWIPGPNMVTAGRIIAPFGGQFRLQPEKRHLAEPEYFYAQTVDEMRKAVRENVHFGATVIKLVVDNQSYIYSEEEIRTAVEEARAMNLKVAAHAVRDPGAQNAIRAGVASIEHGWELSDETLRMMKDRNVYLVNTDFPVDSYYSVTEKVYQGYIDRLRRAYEIGTPIAFGTDVIYYKEGRTRGDLTLDFLQSYVDAGISPIDILRIMTVNAAKLFGVFDTRGTIEVGKDADVIAVDQMPLDDVQALRRVSFVMKDGVVYKRDSRFAWETPRHLRF